jgi:hypothetical protein
MIQENEAITLLLGLGGLIFILANRLQLKHLPASKIFIAGYYVLLAGWALTILEGFFWGEILNLIEHICYTSSAVLMAVWSWMVFGKEGGA